VEEGGMRKGTPVIRTALLFALLLASLTLVVWRQSRALEVLGALEDARGERVVEEARRSGLLRQVDQLESRARVSAVARDRLGMRLPEGDETLPRAALYHFSKDGRDLVMVINSTFKAETMTIGHQSIALQPNSAAILTGRDHEVRLAFESHTASAARPRRPSYRPAKVRLAFRQFAETLPGKWPVGGRCPIAQKSPGSMLPHSHDLTDYGWYTAELKARTSGEVTLTLPMVRDFSTLFVNGRFVGTQPERLEENGPKHWEHEYRLKLKAGVNRISILVAAFGLIKGDWMIDAPQTEEKKGLIGDVRVDGRKTRLNWTLDLGLRGEQLKLFDPVLGAQQKWTAVKKRGGPRLRWFRAGFGGLEPKVKGYALEVGRLHKGLAWLNGQCIGRYWQIPAAPVGEDWQHRFISLTGAGAPTQSHYHLPLEWLRERNTLVIFEETDAAPEGVRIVERR